MTKKENLLWIKITNDLEINGNLSVYKMYIQRLSLKIEEKQITILCPDAHALSLVEKSFRKIIEQTLKKTEYKDYLLFFKVDKDKKANQKTQINKNKQIEEQEKTPLFSYETQDTNHNQSIKTNAQNLYESGLSPLYSFENYLMGSNNQLAYAVAKAVAERPGESYNPLFIYSGVGLGKTHLIQAIGNKILKEKPNLKVVYCTGETFTNSLVEALQTSKGRGQYTMNKFREKFRSADVLLIDDVQFIAGRESTQEEFFHTFNALYMKQKQIVLTSDRPPKDFTDLEDRIKSRFGSGMIVDIQPPDFEMRLAILRNKRDENKDDIPNEILDYIALNVKTNIRELLGAYTQISVASKSMGIKITKEFVAKELGQRISEQKNKNVNLNQILKAVCNYYSVKLEDIKSPKRTKELVLPRHTAMYLIYDITKTPYTTIGQIFGGRDHTSILHGIKKIEQEIKTKPKIKQDVANIIQSIYT